MRKDHDALGSGPDLRRQQQARTCAGSVPSTSPFVTTSTDDEIIVETAYRPDPALWEPDFKTRRKSR